jgi:hypothetical protein
LLHVLRRVLKCSLPVQVWHLGQRELSPAMQGLLRREEVEIVDAQPLLDRYPANIRNGWALKPFAVAHSRFAEVLSLDADALPLVSPEQVFEWPEYHEHGALFWPDLVEISPENPVWAAVGLPARREPALETGQFVLDKSRCWPELALTVALNSQSDQLYQMIYGEKDSFLLAFLLRGQPFNRISHLPLRFDSDLIQRDPAGEPFIHHRTFSKYLFTGPNRPVFGDTLTAAMEDAFRVLREGWTGIVFHPPAMSPAALAMADALAGYNFIYETSGAGRRKLVLNEDFQVGAGSAEYERHWAVIERGGALVLQFFSATRLAIELYPALDGSWHGTGETGLGFSARLVPEAAAATMPFAGAASVALPAKPLVDALLAAAAPGAGFDAATVAQVEAAMALLNCTHDDVPETIQTWLAAHQAVASPWQTALRHHANTLADARDARLRATAPQPGPMDLLRPGFYDFVQ